MTDDTGKKKGPRGLRSPSYPGIPLEAAIKRADQLKAYAPGGKPIPIAVALSQWKYKANSGAGLQQLAALLKFGLLEGKGKKDQRVVVLTDRARRILLDQADSPERAKLIREAALLPTLHAEMRDRWPHGLPDDDSIRSWLLLEKNFNENAVGIVIREVRNTFEYAKLDSEPDTDNDTEDGKDKEGKFKAGDWVQWESQGTLRFKAPKRVAKIEEHKGEQYVYVEGENGAFPMSQAIAANPASSQTGGGMLPTPPTPFVPSTIQKDQPGMAQETSKIGCGTASLIWPESISVDDYADLEYWLNGVLRKAKRSIAQATPQQQQADNEDEPLN